MTMTHQRLQWVGASLRLGMTAAAVLLGQAMLAPAAHAQSDSSLRPSSMFQSIFGPFSAPRYQYGGGPSSDRQVDSSRAPAPKKADVPPAKPILVLGDSMADWLAYGLEDAFADTPEIGVVRKHRTYSGLIQYDSRNESQDWPGVAREVIANEKPRFIVMMLGLNDRQLIRERVPVPRNEKPGQQGNEKPAPDASSDTPDQPGRTRVVVHEFRTEKWAELYAKRIDETIAVLKARGVPVFWAGLPSVRGPKSTSDMLYLNELFRARAEKAGITYIDVWDGFVDESGRFALQGPDLEGQTRRLRTGDGLHFTKPGARKLAHYVEREIRRALATGPVPVVLPASEPQPAPVPTALPGRPTPRPLAGPVLPLTTAPKAAEELLGGDDAQVAIGHATVTRVLVKGEPVESPAGRSDDFAWPRRDVAAFGKDPVAATTNLPIPLMRPLPEKTTVAVPSGETRSVSAKPSPPKRAAQRQQQKKRRDPAFIPFFR
jgi:hypothetical protein